MDVGEAVDGASSWSDGLRWMPKDAAEEATEAIY